MIDIIDLSREQIGLIKRRVRGALYDSEHYSLVLGRRQLALREHVERYDQQDDDRPEHKNHGPILQGPGEGSRISTAYALEAAVNPSGKALLGVSSAQQLRAHHGRQGQGNDAGNDHGSSKSKRKLPEESSRQTTLNADWRIHRG